MKALPKRKGNQAVCPAICVSSLVAASMKALPKRKGNVIGPRDTGVAAEGLNESPSKKEGKSRGLQLRRIRARGLNESPSKKEGKWPPKTSPQPCGRNGYPARTSRQATQKVYPNQPTRAQTSVTSQNTTRATRHVPVTYQVLAHTKTPAGCFLSDPARVFTYERGWRGSGKPD